MHTYYACTHTHASQVSMVVSHVEQLGWFALAKSQYLVLGHLLLEAQFAF